MAMPGTFARRTIKRAQERVSAIPKEEELARTVIGLSKSSGKSVDVIMSELSTAVKDWTKSAVGERAFRVNVASAGGYTDTARVRRLAKAGRGETDVLGGGGVRRAAGAVGSGAQAAWEKKTVKGVAVAAGLAALPFVTVPVATGAAAHAGRRKIKSAFKGAGGVASSVWKGLP